ncbi:YrdB family protein [Bacillus sp. FJAT-49736]|uniref:YrdB family protein n=1 Tax=Bacillus sp. FJAT-49736 TaxID=2833582 RepID=UPI001BCA4C98|nr:YrdB family protein [Bacillus sp. FJAT-49736]MBS4174716.1 YrdB family protein [Bacillus sp. FJAT-49736]
MFAYLFLTILFLIELAALAAYSYWGFHVGKGIAMKLLLGIGTPLFVAYVWGLFLAPKAKIPVNAPLNIMLKLIVFGLASAALYATGRHIIAGAFFMVALIALVLDNLLKI